VAKWWVEICPYPDVANGQVKTLGPFKTEREADRAERGVNINLNHHDYYTMVSSVAVAPQEH
jgi:hypothetical protein